MQWIALDETTPITASQALKQIIYACPECHQPVRVRSGPHRQAHFYHLRSISHCEQHKKSEEHLRLQLALASLMPPGEGRIERPFPEINRIADVAWEKRKILFEIQCSPISLSEVEARGANYREVGWTLIWILSDKRFNKRKLCAAESYLRSETCYFFKTQTVHIYDQYEVLKGHRRLYKGPPIAINPLILPHRPQASLPLPDKTAPPPERLPRLSWPILFKKIYQQCLDRLLRKL